ncbi:MAG: N-acetylmuramoyl-L-alanine amidase [Clostridia bacterium]|nr:N-acetylmuramoyl-L-alanine amidase [Clostridia bacterium]
MFFVFRKNVIIGVLLAVLASGILVLSAVPKEISTVGLNPKVIVVDAGHGGMDGGGVGVDGTLEKDLNLQIAKKLEKALTENGYRVVMTRTEDLSLHDDGKTTVRSQKNSDLKNRAKIANQSRAGLFVSIHMNKYESPEVKGAQVFYRKNDPTGAMYAESIMAELKKIDPENHRMEKVLPNKNLTFSKLEIPGVLVECGFISNEEELDKLCDEAYQDKIVESIVGGIKNIP